MSKVKIQSVQAVKYIEFDMPEGGGGVRLFRGPNGAGKTTAINCINALLGRKINLAPTEGAPKGLIEGLGVSKTIQSRTTTKGESEVATLEGRFDFSDLVDPPIKDAAARNKSRIRALVGLTAQQCSPADFAPLFDSPEEFEAIAGDESDGLTDPLEIADAIKKASEREARQVEAKVDDDTSRWQLAVEQSKGANAEVEPEPIAELAAKYAAAKDALDKACQLHRDHAKATEHNAKVDAQRLAHDAKKPAATPEVTGERLKKIRAEIKRLADQMATAKLTEIKLEAEFKTALEWDERLSELESSKVDPPASLPEIAPLEAAVTEALRALESAEERKSRYESAVRAKQLAESIQANRERAAALRAVAASTSSVVTKMLPKSCPLQVSEDGVLGVEHPGRGHWVAIDELSEGERWEVGLAVAIEAVGPGGVIPVRQEAWQSLDSESRRAIAKQCKAAKVYLVSAEVGEGDLRVEEYDGE